MTTLKTTAPDLLLEDETLRDGLQMEDRLFSLEEKRGLYRRLADAGIQRIQVGSFVNPKKVPQMAGTEEFIQAIRTDQVNGPLITALILNERGLQRAIGCGIGHVSMSVSLSDTHSRKNTGKSAADALAAMSDLIAAAAAAGLDVRAGLQCSFGCGYEGAIDERKVLSAALRFAEAGALEVNLADTAGMADPLSIARLTELVSREIPELSISLHLHDTRGLGLANMYAGYQAGVRTFDTCTGGLGGCPFVKGAAGNVPTEDAVHMFSSMGVQTGIDLARVCDTVGVLENLLGRKLPGRMRTILNAEKQDADE